MTVHQGDVSFNTRLFVGGDVSFNSRLTVYNDVSFNNRLFVGGDVSFNGNVFIGKDATIIGRLIVQQYSNQNIINISTTNYNYNLIISEDISLNNRLFIGGDVSFNSRLTVYNDVSFNNRLFVGGDVSVNGNVTCNELIISNSNLSNNGYFLSGINTQTGSTTSNISGFLFSGLITASGGIISNGDVSFNNRLYLAQDLSVNGNLSVTNTITCNNIQYTSDYRIKNSIKELNTNHNIDNIRPIEYINTILNKKDMGILAHELQELYPFLVSGEKDGKELQTVNYNGIIALLINEVKNLKKVIQNLENTNKKHENIENFISIDVSNSTIILDFNENISTYFVNNSENNFTIHYNNYPLTKSTIHKMTLLVDNNNYGNSIFINGLSTTIKYNNLLPVDSKYITQTISIINNSTNSQTNNYFVTSNVKGFE